MSMKVLGIHHITAIAGDPQSNIDFYSGLLGLRLIKVTVNFDDPGTYHLYYGDGAGHPGTILTFFPWPHAPKGRHGVGQVTHTAFAIPLAAIDFWKDRLAQQGVSVQGPYQRFDDIFLLFRDPDGMMIELVSIAELDSARVHKDGAIPLNYAIHGLHSATLSEHNHQQTHTMLTETLGFNLINEHADRFRYSVGHGEAGALIDVLRAPDQRPGSVLVGAVHHIAWRTSNDEEQLEWLDRIREDGYSSSPVMDRKYFHSIYFREPGGILFEIATDPPGFSVNETPDELGSKLVLPPWLESSRQQLQAALPPLRLPAGIELHS